MVLGVSINLMPLATFHKLNIGELKLTSISLQLANKSTRRPVDLVEDVLVRVNKFILPVDFVMLNMSEDHNLDNKMPIILGRPFMARAGVKSNVHEGTIQLKILGEKVKLQIFTNILLRVNKFLKRV